MAAGLVKAYEGHKFVYLHLLCQGFENIGKAMLLAKDYDKYGPQIKPVYHHHLDKLLREVETIYGEVLSPKAKKELLSLNNFYKQQQLRYGDTNDFTIDSSSINANYLHKELVNLLGILNQRFESKHD